MSPKRSRARMRVLREDLITFYKQHLPVGRDQPLQALERCIVHTVELLKHTSAPKTNFVIKTPT